jgi:PhnB protein
MSAPAVKPIPEGMHSLTPHLICAGAADAIKFYTEAFGAIEQFRLPGPEGKLMHACVKIGDSRALKGSPVAIHLYVPNVDAVVAQAAEAGARVTMPAADMFWGDRFAQLEDPFGHRWSVATHQRDVPMEEMQAAVRAMQQ